MRLYLESHLLASFSVDMPFLRDPACSPASLLPQARTSLSSTTLLGVPPACFLGRGQSVPVRLCLESRQLASSGKDKPFLRDSGWCPTCMLPRAWTSLSCATLHGDPPASFLRRGQAFPTRVDLESHQLASSGEDRPFSRDSSKSLAYLLPQARTSLS